MEKQKAIYFSLDGSRMTKIFVAGLTPHAPWHRRWWMCSIALCAATYLPNGSQYWWVSFTSTRQMDGLRRIARLFYSTLDTDRPSPQQYVTAMDFPFAISHYQSHVNKHNDMLTCWHESSKRVDMLNSTSPCQTAMHGTEAWMYLKIFVNKSLLKTNVRVFV